MCHKGTSHSITGSRIVWQATAQQANSYALLVMSSLFGTKGLDIKFTQCVTKGRAIRLIVGTYLLFPTASNHTPNVGSRSEVLNLQAVTDSWHLQNQSFGTFHLKMAWLVPSSHPTYHRKLIPTCCSRRAPSLAQRASTLNLHMPFTPCSLFGTQGPDIKFTHSIHSLLKTLHQHAVDLEHVPARNPTNNQ